MSGERSRSRKPFALKRRPAIILSALASLVAAFLLSTLAGHISWLRTPPWGPSAPNVVAAVPVLQRAKPLPPKIVTIWEDVVVPNRTKPRTVTTQKAPSNQAPPADHDQSETPKVPGTRPSPSVSPSPCPAESPVMSIEDGGRIECHGSDGDD